MRKSSLVVLIVAVLPIANATHTAAQIPLIPPTSSGRTVTPAFEGWYRNPDGSFSLSFGYFNRNFREALEVPVGPDNSIEPGGPDHGQPTRFEPRRHWGVFAVRVPADFGDATLTWTLRVRGETFAIPGSLNPLWEIDALEGEAGSGNTPPVLRFSADGPAGAGPGGITTGPLVARVGQPMTLTVWATDDGRASTSIVSDGRPNVPVSLAWFKHQGQGSVTFADAEPAVNTTDHSATTTVTFDAPGSYILRVRANDASGVASAGHSQCCWSNGFVKVSVTR